LAVSLAYPREEGVHVISSCLRGAYTDKKESEIFLIYKEYQMGSGCKFIYEEGLPMRKCANI
jgi:hypothetical protein